MTSAPDISYARTHDGVHIAYQVVGDGPVDLVVVMGWTTNIEALWEEPDLARFFRGLTRFSRLIIFDKRGVGLSDRVPEDRLPDLETRMDDVRAVMDAAGSERAIVFGISEGGPMAALFAATYPERTVALVLFGTQMDYTNRRGTGPEETDEYLAYIDQHWGTSEHARMEISSWGAPSRADDEQLVAWLSSYLRRAASPGAAIALSRMNRGINASHALPAIHVPTLVLAKIGDRDFLIEEVRDMAAQIADKRLIEYPGDEHFWWLGDYEVMLTDIQAFVTEFRDQEAELERSLATVLFTDIVGSTERAAELGDRRWGELLEEHHRRVRGQLARFKGIEIDTAGDGFFATFDGPARSVRCAQAIMTGLGPVGLSIRAGCHTGELHTIDGKVGGMAVNIGARVGALAGSSEILVSQTVKDLTSGSGLTFEDAGEHDLKGVPDSWRLYRVTG